MTKQLQDLAILCDYLRIMEAEAEDKAKKLKTLTERIDYFKTDVIPTYIQSLGLSEFKLEDGTEVTIGTKYYCNISEERSEAAFKWLTEHGHESLIKSTITLKFGAGLEEKVDHAVLKNFLTESDMTFDEKKAVHAQTLKSFVKGAVEDGTPIPYDLFGVYIAKEVHVGK